MPYCVSQWYYNEFGTTIINSHGSINLHSFVFKILKDFTNNDWFNDVEVTIDDDDEMTHQLEAMFPDTNSELVRDAVQSSITIEDSIDHVLTEISNKNGKIACPSVFIFD